MISGFNPKSWGNRSCHSGQKSPARPGSPAYCDPSESGESGSFSRAASGRCNSGSESKSCTTHRGTQYDYRVLQKSKSHSSSGLPWGSADLYCFGSIFCQLSDSPATLLSCVEVFIESDKSSTQECEARP